MKEVVRGMRPYRFEQGQFDAVRMHMQGVSPDVQKHYAALETHLGERFVALYGTYLNDEQRAYMRTPRLITTVNMPGQGLNEVLKEQFNSGVETYSPRSPLNGRFYKRYGFAPPEWAAQGADFQLSTPDAFAYQYWAGRFGVIPIVPDMQDVIVEPSHLNSRGLLVYSAHSEDPAHKAVQATSNWSSVAVHEKVHGVQAFDLPLPFLEMDANYREKELFEQNGWLRMPSEHFVEASDYWESLMRELGPDGHRFMFGNGDAAIDAEILTDLQSRFTEEDMADLFPADHVNEYVVWDTQPVESV